MATPPAPRPLRHRLLPLLLPPLLLLLLPRLRSGAAAAEDCAQTRFRSGQEDFVLDAEDAAKEGAALLAAAQAHSAPECERACCALPRCDLAMLGPNGTCVLYSCVHRNRFVCRFVNQPGFRTYVRDTVYRKHLAGPQESRDPIANAGRDVIVQPGEAVTLNGIESLALGDAHIVRYQWSAARPSEFKGGMEATEFPDQVRLLNLQPGSYDFLLTVTDSNDQSDDAQVTVHVLSAEESSAYCRVPAKVGPCRGSFTRWHYDAVTGSCTDFLFGGCKANKNNFLRKEECELACRGVTATSERSLQIDSKELCGISCVDNMMTCDNGCCLDASLECDGVANCGDKSDETHCDKLNRTFNRLMSIDVNERKARCAEPPMTGPCRASHTRWYYDPLDRKCHRFTYGGCLGNDNNFDADDKCSNTCDGVTERNVYFRGMFNRYEKEEEDDSDDSASIAVAVVLSVAILALLAVLSYCFLKKRRAQSRSPAPSGPAANAHVALSEQETLVYNSTTKPV